MGKLSKLKTGFLAALTLLFGAGINLALPLATYAEAQVGITPVQNEIVLQPGQTYTSSFNVFNNGDEDLNYKVYVTPYQITSDDSGATQQVYDGVEGDNQYTTIVDWIEVDTETGTVAPNSGQHPINYTITVPDDAAPGGQYAAIMVEQTKDSNTSGNAGLSSTVRAAYLIYATVAGNVTETASISDVRIPGIFVDSKITASHLGRHAQHRHLPRSGDRFPLWRVDQHRAHRSGLPLVADSGDCLCDCLYRSLADYPQQKAQTRQRNPKCLNPAQRRRPAPPLLMRLFPCGASWPLAPALDSCSWPAALVSAQRVY